MIFFSASLQPPSSELANITVDGVPTTAELRAYLADMQSQRDACILRQLFSPDSISLPHPTQWGELDLKALAMDAETAAARVKHALDIERAAFLVDSSPQRGLNEPAVVLWWRVCDQFLEAFLAAGASDALGGRDYATSKSQLVREHLSEVRQLLHDFQRLLPTTVGNTNWGDNTNASAVPWAAGDPHAGVWSVLGRDEELLEALAATYPCRAPLQARLRISLGRAIAAICALEATPLRRAQRSERRTTWPTSPNCGAPWPLDRLRRSVSYPET